MDGNKPIVSPFTNYSTISMSIYSDQSVVVSRTDLQLCRVYTYVFQDCHVLCRQYEVICRDYEVICPMHRVIGRFF